MRALRSAKERRAAVSCSHTVRPRPSGVNHCVNSDLTDLAGLHVYQFGAPNTTVHDVEVIDSNVVCHESAAASRVARVREGEPRVVALRVIIPGAANESRVPEAWLVAHHSLLAQ